MLLNSSYNIATALCQSRI